MHLQWWLGLSGVLVCRKASAYIRPPFSTQCNYCVKFSPWDYFCYVFRFSTLVYLISTRVFLSSRCQRRFMFPSYLMRDDNPEQGSSIDAQIRRHNIRRLCLCMDLLLHSVYLYVECSAKETLHLLLQGELTVFLAFALLKDCLSWHTVIYFTGLLANRVLTVNQTACCFNRALLTVLLPSCKSSCLWENVIWQKRILDFYCSHSSERVTAGRCCFCAGEGKTCNSAHDGYTLSVVTCITHSVCQCACKSLKVFKSILKLINNCPKYFSGLP